MTETPEERRERFLNAMIGAARSVPGDVLLSDQDVVLDALLDALSPIEADVVRYGAAEAVRRLLMEARQ